MWIDLGLLLMRQPGHQSLAKSLQPVLTLAIGYPLCYHGGHSARILKVMSGQKYGANRVAQEVSPRRFKRNFPIAPTLPMRRQNEQAEKARGITSLRLLPC